MVDVVKRPTMNFSGGGMPRRVVDYSGGAVKMIENRLWQRDKRDIPLIQPDSTSYSELILPQGLIESPVNAVTTKFVRAVSNKVRCPIFCTSWVPDGRRVVCGAHSGEFTLWNGINLTFENSLQAHDTPVRSMQWSHNGVWMVTSDDRGFVKYWQSNLNNVHTFQAHTEPIRSTSFSPTDTKLATSSVDGTVRVFDFIRCSEEFILRGHGADVMSVDWHPRKGLLASGSKDNQQPVKLWDPKSGQSVATLHAHKAAVMSVQWNANGNWLLTGSRDHLIKLFDIRTMKEMCTLRSHKKEVNVLAWHPVHETLFASGGSDGAILFWEVGNEREIGGMEAAHDSFVWSLSWHPLGHFLVSGSNDTTSKFWCRNRPGDEMKDGYNSLVSALITSADAEDYHSMNRPSFTRTNRGNTDAITLPPPSQTFPFDNTPNSQPNPSDTASKNTNLAVLGADIIAETFGDRKNEPQESKGPFTPTGQRQFFGPDNGQQQQLFRPPKVERPSVPHSQGQQFRPPPPPPNFPGREFGRPEFRSPTSGGPSPFSWQRAEFGGGHINRRPSFEEETHTPQREPRNPYVYRRPDVEPPRDGRDPRMFSGGGPRRGGGRRQDWGPEAPPTSGPPPQGWQGGPPPMRPGEEQPPPPRDMRGPPPPHQRPDNWSPGGDRRPPPQFPDQGPPPGEHRPPDHPRPLPDPRAQPRSQSEQFQPHHPQRNESRPPGEFNRPSPQAGTPPSQDPRFPPGRQGQPYGAHGGPPPPGRPRYEGDYHPPPFQGQPPFHSTGPPDPRRPPPQEHMYAHGRPPPDMQQGPPQHQRPPPHEGPPKHPPLMQSHDKPPHDRSGPPQSTSPMGPPHQQPPPPIGPPHGQGQQPPPHGQGPPHQQPLPPMQQGDRPPHQQPPPPRGPPHGPHTMPPRDGPTQQGDRPPHQQPPPPRGPPHGPHTMPPRDGPPQQGDRPPHQRPPPPRGPPHGPHTIPPRDGPPQQGDRPPHQQPPPPRGPPHGPHTMPPRDGPPQQGDRPPHQQPPPPRGPPHGPHTMPPRDGPPQQGDRPPHQQPPPPRGPPHGPHTMPPRDGPPQQGDRPPHPHDIPPYGGPPTQHDRSAQFLERPPPEPYRGGPSDPRASDPRGHQRSDNLGPPEGRGDGAPRRGDPRGYRQSAPRSRGRGFRPPPHHDSWSGRDPRDGRGRGHDPRGKDGNQMPPTKRPRE